MPPIAKAVTKKGIAAGSEANKAPAKAPKKAVGKAAEKASAPGRGQRRRALPLEQRRHYVEVAAYFIAERDGFAPGCELAHWAAAEAEIDRLLAAGLLNP